jgi:hypothetical protein
MARWMGIQTGIIKDIPDIFSTVISRSHEQGQSVVMPDDSYYTAGWFINGDKTIIEHGGGNPGYSTYVLLFSDEKAGITVLANVCGVNAKQIAENIMSVLDGHPARAYSIGETQMLDILLSFITVIGVALAILFFILGFRRLKQTHKKPISKKRIAMVAVWVTITLALLCIMCFPNLVLAGGWTVALTWMSYSLLTSVISLTLLCSGIVYFMLTPVLPIKHTGI